MSLSKKGVQIGDTQAQLNTSSKVKTLNPNAAEFVPFALRSSSASGSNSVADVTAKFATSGNVGKAFLDRSDTSVSNNSDDEVHQFWRSQLPDDIITPDFTVINEDVSQGIGDLSLSGLSLLDNTETSRFPVSRFASSAGSGYGFNEQQELSPQNLNGSGFSEKIGYSASSYSEDSAYASYMHSPGNLWGNQLVNSDQLTDNGIEGNSYDASGLGFTNDMLADHTQLDNAGMNPFDFLAAQFPEFSLESLEEVYFANGGDINLTIEMLTQLELQVDSGFNQNLNSKALSAPNLTAMDFPALTVSDGQNSPSKYVGDDLHPNANPYRPLDKENLLMFKTGPSLPSGGSINFASAVKKLPSQDSGSFKYERNGSSGSTVGSSRSSHLLADVYSTTGHGRGVYGDRLQSRGSARTAPVWLETGDAVANMYSELREDARDHARLRNAYFEQARQAYLVGNKALAKELSVKGQLHNMHMKEAHGKAQESIYRQRNPVGPENARGQERMIDLHGLHVSEAISVLKHELSVLRSTARAADRRLQVYICVGTGHHTRGSRTPARLPVSVQRYLLEEEGLDFTEPQPGLLRVVLY